MTRNIIIAVVFILIIVLLAYYFKPSSLSLSEKGVSLQVKQKTFLLESTSVKKSAIHETHLNIMQTKLSDGSYYEVASVEPLYEFNYNLSNIIKIIFKAEKVEEIFAIRGVSAMQVTLKNAQVINLFLEDIDQKELKIHYGIAYDVYVSYIKQIMGNEFTAVPVGGLLDLPAPMTHWDLVRADTSAEILVSIDH